ncbi:hypothetical protein HLH34_17545 [Gluconacetobacter azotocaptans]|uniref:Glycosyltransferase RgtA/B/C/D-like domain-containing protein n=1 Tax=Gluconacetobacter azotocaptans TaxID=142834 RepID=A0A7W4JVM2_9PROT|nr:mannosyltransferase family protein [Gluconacetobacter azotocaptans]MBB2191740.1 hypothetical protein [Gluconacetobacter azotocaptans]GBQ34208.1 hypothetical protein AA13594_2831 [Gluconacetobacter azotocaptans DSM 13594]
MTRFSAAGRLRDAVLLLRRFPVFSILAAYALSIAGLCMVARPFGSVPRALCRWDCFWYERIAAKGYDLHPILDGLEAGFADWAFFPAYPLLLRLVSYMTGMSGHESGMLISVVLLPVLALVSLSYVRRQGYVADHAAYWTILFMVFPTAIWYRFPYTETLYGVLLVGCAYAARVGYIGVACTLAAGLCATRPTGLVCVVAIGLYRMFSAWEPGGGRPVRQVGVRFLEGAAIIAVGAIGLAAFILYLDRLTGDGLAFSHIQYAWRHTAHLPTTWLWYGMTHKGLWVVTALDLLAFSVILYGFYIGWYLESTILLLTFGLATSVGLFSVHRFIFANPFCLMLILTVIDRSSPIIRYTALILGLCIDYILLRNWFYGYDLLT